MQAVIGGGCLCGKVRYEVRGRGFCGECGSNLFFEEVGGERVSIAAGSLDEPQGLAIAAHIFASEAGDYYEIDDSVPVAAKGDHNVRLPDG